MDSARSQGDWQLPEPRLASRLPDFLIVSPPKTGSTWLAGNLNFHPEIFVPEIKEIHYFNRLLHLKTWDWYTEHFRSGPGLTKGEATPGYCQMPPDRVRLIHAAMPKLKLIYLMREPVGQAWSQARHCLRHRLTTFENYHARPEEVPDDRWIESFTDASSMGSLRVQEHLQSWLACFPKEQLYVDFYSAIIDEPEQLLQRIFKFLGVGAIADFSHYPLREKLNEGVSCPLSPHLREFLQRQLSPGVPELADFLQREFQLRLPPAWTPLLQAGTTPFGPGESSAPPRCEPASPLKPAPPRRGLSFAYFEKHRLELKYTSRTRICDYFGFHIVSYKDIFFAISHALGDTEPILKHERLLARLEAKRLLFRATSLTGVKLKVAGSELANARRAEAGGFTTKVIGWLRHSANHIQDPNRAEPHKPPCDTRATRGRRVPRTRNLDFHGYQIIYHKGMFLGVAHTVGAFEPRQATESAMARLEKEGLLFRSRSLEYVQLQIAEKHLALCVRGPRRRSIVIRAPRFLLRRLGAFASDMNAKLRARSR